MDWKSAFNGMMLDTLGPNAPRLGDDDLDAMARQEQDRLGIVPKADKREALWVPRFNGDEPTF